MAQQQFNASTEPITLVLDACMRLVQRVAHHPYLFPLNSAYMRTLLSRASPILCHLLPPSTSTLGHGRNMSTLNWLRPRYVTRPRPSPIPYRTSSCSLVANPAPSPPRLTSLIARQRLNNSPASASLLFFFFFFF